ncbi:helix-turn-helix domain-containing protein [Nakamurella leprariae]|uniref:Helix-turn-helix transcriptional regulator n=1 Tax=Nakamurella leprariae TaxID=2803911 RepID=A0A938YA49_9ACTN|nr:helix-turn-helix transcriptional regulator [Nakamurella leprariae]MBM9468766.1 helix-turn-helix transcriptional regulator [Nakamurella leprariae]
MSGEEFRRGNSRLRRMLADPQTRDQVTAVREEMAQADRTHKMNLAAIRNAANLTQDELAARMGIKQAAVSGVEARSDLLLSTLANYLRAAGGTDARVVVTLNGQDVELPLTSILDDDRQPSS